MFVSEYQTLHREAEAGGAKIFSVDEAHFRADVDVRQMWTQRGVPALVDSTSPRLGEKATYYSTICLETGEIEAMPVKETCTTETTVTFLKQLRTHSTNPLVILWDNGPAHRGQEIRDHLSTPDVKLRLVALPAYSPDFNADEAIWDWVREEATANTCFGTKARVRQAVDHFFASLAARTAEASRRCRTKLQARADAMAATTHTANVDLTPVSL